MDSASLLRESRTLQGLTQTELAHRSGVSLPTVQNLEAGRANPTLATLQAVLNALGLELSLEPRSADWDELALCGAPLMVGGVSDAEDGGNKTVRESRHGPTPDLLPEFRGLHDEFRAEIEKVLRAGVAAGVIRKDIDCKAQAAILLATQRGIAFQWLLDPDNFPLDAAYDELKRNLRRTLAP